MSFECSTNVIKQYQIINKTCNIKCSIEMIYLFVFIFSPMIELNFMNQSTIKQLEDSHIVGLLNVSVHPLISVIKVLLNMYTKLKSEKCVLLICQIFGTNFSQIKQKSPAKHKIATFKLIFALQIVYVFFDVLLIFLTFPPDMSRYKYKFDFVLHMFQVMLPQLFKMLVVFQAFKEKEQQRHIEMELLKIKEFIKGTFRKHYVNNRQSKASGKFLRNFLIIISTRVVKLCTIKYTAYTFSTAISELTLSSNDLLFTFYVDYLKELNQIVNCSLKSKKQIEEKEIKSLRTISKRIFNISQNIVSRYSLSLLSIAGFNFGISVINLYWLFMRLSYGQLKELRGDINYLSTIVILFDCFFYSRLCYISVFYSTMFMFVHSF